MPTLFVANLDFEHQLGPGGSRTLPASVRRRNEEMAAVWAAVAAAGDFLWLPASVEAGFLESLAESGLPLLHPVRHPRQVPSGVEFCPWGWTEALRAWAAKHGWRCQAPADAVVREANSRRFSARLEGDWEVAPPGSAVVSTLDELAAAVGRLPAGWDRWIVKAEFGMAARERMLGRGRELPRAVVEWAGRRLRSGGCLFLEPWLDRVDEVGVQFTVLPRGGARLEGIVPLLVSPSGSYRGSRFSHDAEEAAWGPAIEVAARTAERLARRGYHGPLGIDAMRYRAPDGTLHLRPLQDVNARWTMGRLSLGFRRLLSGHEFGWWLHVPSDAAVAGNWSDGHGAPHACAPEARPCPVPVVSRPAPEIRLIRTSPWEVAGERATHLSFLAIGPSEESLEPFLSALAPPGPTATS